MYISTQDSTLNSSINISPNSYPPIKEVLQGIQAAAGGDSELYNINPDVLAEKFEAENFTTVSDEHGCTHRCPDTLTCDVPYPCER